MVFRHEWKHEINMSDMIALRQRLGAVTTTDQNAKGGKYEIRSLYFDNLEDKVLREKLDGISKREKFRIRYYNNDTSTIYLEKKSKDNGLGTKEKVLLTVGEVQKILNGDYEFMIQTDKRLLHEFYSKIKSQGLRPKTIVDYTREPFVYAPGNVRITLDYNIRSGLHRTDFLDANCVMVPVPDNPIILEVKWDEFLPTIIRDIVQLEGRRTSSFSKYAACRIYSY